MRRVLRRRAFERLERTTGKLVRCVLGGGGGSNIILLPDNMIREGQVEGIGKATFKDKLDSWPLSSRLLPELK
jgi:hypothetical protein